MKVVLVVVFIIILSVISIFSIYRQSENKLPIKETKTPNVTVQPSSKNVNIQAEFKIMTGDITRNFNNPKYHNQSKDVFIEQSNPNIVHVKKEGVTWLVFFNTLPMQLSENCLLTGDGESLCDGEEGKLQFFLNGLVTPDLLKKEIRNGDDVKVVFHYN